jgi:hypothetical protein
MGQNRPLRALSGEREIGVTFNHELPTGRAEVLSVNGSASARGGPLIYPSKRTRLRGHHRQTSVQQGTLRQLQFNHHLFRGDGE